MSDLKGPGDARPTALDIIRDEKRENAFVGKVAVITGCSSGIGPPTAEALLATGATLYCTARDVEKAKKALAPLLSSGRVHVLFMDHTDLSTVKAAADEIRRRVSAISLLINNAGVMMVPTRTETKDGFEMHMATNHLAHFYLFCLLRDHLEAGSAPDFASRVVNVASSGHRWAKPDLDDLQLEKEGAYTPMAGYAASKTANIYMANEIDRRYGSATKAIHGYSLMPGGIRTPLQRHSEEFTEEALKKPELRLYMRSPEQGAATSVFAAVARELEGKGGVYLENCTLAAALTADHDFAGDDGILYGYAPWAFDPAKEGKLWTKSLQVVGLPEDF
ncbi:short-chain dehydrogenase/reductase [Sporothrix brasiliensis 5110]|uniref:Short-chain dehydrogenase/reductase n=1 Tax=Sporothrix brasiliensis 5110 TaxID=1398154 RepID=A0A0C2IUB2_9PEZI|nr:short-chain dehydrogenase/reductase [Sporothrix brasiliensis 5110]KIH88587.1 short-chain dehydrogenase/reductase [Sporothrix brasiliensis 5110]